MSSTEEGRIRILLVEEESLVRAALRKLLESWPEFEIVGSASRTKEALELLDHLEPHVVLLTLTGGDTHSLDIIRDFAQRAEQLLVLLGEGLLPNSPAEVVRLGARGVVRKNKAPDELRRAIKKVHEGRLAVLQAWGDAGNQGIAVDEAHP